MNSKEVFVNLSQVIGINGSDYPSSEDCNRELVVHVSRNTTNTVSHVTTEFRGMTSKFFCCMMFDGSGDMGIGITGFAMPKMKINQSQKALALLTILDYLIQEGHLKASFEFFKARIEGELSSLGFGGILQRYKFMSDRSKHYISEQLKGSKLLPNLANTR